MKVRIPSGPSQQDMMKQFKKLQEDMAAKQEELDAREYEVSSGGGMVTVKITGTKEVLSVKINPEAASDLEMLEDLILAAVNEAIQTVENTNESEMGKLTGSMNLPNIPGLM